MPKTLLLADDSVTIQKVVGISFANEDVVLLTVDNGDDAVARAREARPDLVLADVMMPGKDGYEVCEILKSDPELRHVPVLLLSGTFEPFDEERARRVGADGHITKPFEAQALVDQVNALLARAAAAPKPPEMAMPADPAPASDPAAGDAFDFFDDEMARTAPSPARAAAPSLHDPVGIDDGEEPVELEAAVEDDEPGFAPSPARDDFLRDAGDSQATMVLGEPAAATIRSATPPPFFGDGFEAEALETPAAAPLATAAAHPEADAPAGYEESFDFGFDEGAAMATTPVFAASAAPAAPAPSPPAAPPPTPALFDDDDDDADPWAAAAPPPVATPSAPRMPAPAPPPVPKATPPPVVPLAPPAMRDLAPPAPELAPPPAPPPVRELTPPPPPPVHDLAPPAPEPMREPALREPAPPPVPELAPPPPPPAMTAPPAPPAAPAPSAPLASGPAASGPVSVQVSGPSALSASAQKQLQETLEKIVWEAFGELTERIVRDVIERVETVAWEVIPQMAETLIREEIRRLKDGDES